MQAMMSEAPAIVTDIPKSTNSPSLRQDAWATSGWISASETKRGNWHYPSQTKTPADEINAQIWIPAHHWDRIVAQVAATGTAEVLLWQRIAALLPAITETFRIISATGTVPDHQRHVPLVDAIIKSRRVRSNAAAPTVRAVTRSLHLESVHWMKAKTGLSYERIAKLVGVTRQTLNRWERGERIADVNRRRLLAVRDVLERASIRYASLEELTTWLDTPYGVGGRTAAELLEKGDINRARLFAIATPSPHVLPAPVWVGRSIPVAFQAGAERIQEALPPEQEIGPDDELDNEPGASDAET